MPAKNRYKLILAYDGAAYSGWQVQPNGQSIQAVLRDALRMLTREDVYPVASGRTDAGVHAKGQVAHFSSVNELDLFRFHRAINGVLPRDIRVVSIEKVPLTFHARFNVSRKIYHYHLHLDPVDDPFVSKYRWHVYYPVDIDLLVEAANQFVGTHDFSTFSNEASKGAAAKNAVRTIYRISIVKQEGGVRLEFEGNGFLYKMVRNIVGTLVEVSTGRRPIASIKELLLMKDRRRAGHAAPAHALFLMEVDYESLSKNSFNEA